MNNQGDNSTSPIRSTSNKDTGYRTSNDSPNRPIGNPKSTKDFKKIYRADDDEDDEDFTADNVDGENEVSGLIASKDGNIAKSKRPASVFDLNSNAAKTKSADALARAQAAMSDEEPIVGDALDKPFVIADDHELVANKDVTESATTFVSNDNTKDKKTPGFQEAGRGRLDAAVDQPEQSSNTNAATPKDVFAKMTSDESRAKSIAAKEEVEASISPIGDGKEKFTTRFATEQSDLTYINPMAPNTQQIAAAEVTAGKPLSATQNLQELINQIVDRAYQLEVDGKTETTVVLKQPPLLAGANLIVTGFDSAKGEFNISFENLTQAAKNMLDMRANQDSLMHALEQKGYAVHIITTTTLIENRPIETQPSGQQNRERGEEQQSRDERQQQRRNRNT